FAGQPIEVELLVEGQSVAKTQVRVPEGSDVAPIVGLKMIPQTPGEKKVTIRVPPLEGEFVTTNNEISTFVTVLSGGLNVMFLQGPNFTWDYRFLMRSIMTSRDIEVVGAVIRRPARGEASEVDDAEFAPGRYNVYVLSDLPADYLAPRQHRLLAEAVKKGAGLMMLGGRTSFGAGGWAQTDLADILPAEIHPGDGQLEPEGGIKFVPSTSGLTSYVLQIGASRAETAKLWDMMPPILGTNRFGEPKKGAEVLAQTPGPSPEPLMIAMDGPGAGRVIAYGGDTWVWARAFEEGRIAHRKFWRQVIFWLSHKENQGDNQVKLNLDRRRLSVGQNLEMTVTARDAKGAPLNGLTYETKVEREGLNPTSEPVDLYTQGDEAKGSYAAVGQPGDYKVSVIARHNGQEVGRDSSRFLVYQDDRELENPSADLALARQIAEITGGEAVAHEALGKYLKGIDQSSYTEYLSPTEHKIWDNWPFLLIFAALLTMEWWLRKRHGWV
ncbi:MAG: glutamine amidotransferase, partial [Isosphaeraceae bacterium]